ncbi:MAG TPA: D-alanyl-D-alanine carboxypeptidase family protein [Pseudogracilibacillus sp.]|nr:D-alanyl-D-alanine carboxypeptidase family protein [Pseudogracilibacillus sp.]
MRSFMIRFTILFSILFFLFPTVGQSIEKVQVSANNAVLIEESTGRILFEKQAHEKRPVASITKLMTAIIAIEQGKLEDIVVPSDRAIHMEGSSIYLQKSEKMSLEDLLYGLMLRSGNDAAVAIAEHIAGSVEGFVFLMNEKASYLGMTNTHFANPHGLDEDGHYSSAYDIAILMKYAMDNDVFKEIASTEHYQSDNRTYQWQNKNKLLTQLYNYCTGGKTGFTNKAGRTLVASAQKESLSLIAVTLDAPDDWNDHIHLFEQAFKEYDLVILEKEGKRTFVSEEKFISGFIKDEVIVPLKKEEKENVRKQAILKQISTDTSTSETEIGSISYYLSEEEIAKIPVYDAETKKRTFLDELFRVIGKFLRYDYNG